MRNYPSLTHDELKWQSECDAETLAFAEEINCDPARLERAQLCAAEKAKGKEEEAENLKKVATGKLSYPHMNTTEKGE